MKTVTSSYHSNEFYLPTLKRFFKNRIVLCFVLNSSNACHRAEGVGTLTYASASLIVSEGVMPHKSQAHIWTS